MNRNKALNKLNKSYVSNEENLKAEAELRIAEAEVASKKTELDEADLILNQARRGPGSIAADRSASRRSLPTSATPSNCWRFSSGASRPSFTRWKRRPTPPVASSNG